MSPFFAPLSSKDIRFSGGSLTFFSAVILSKAANGHSFVCLWRIPPTCLGGWLRWIYFREGLGNSLGGFVGVCSLGLFLATGEGCCFSLRRGSSYSFGLAYLFLTYFSCTYLTMSSIDVLTLGLLNYCKATANSLCQWADTPSTRLALSCPTACSTTIHDSNCPVLWTSLVSRKDLMRGGLPNSWDIQTHRSQEKPLGDVKGTTGRLSVAVGAHGVFFTFEESSDDFLLLFSVEHYLKLKNK